MRALDAGLSSMYETVLYAGERVNAGLCYSNTSNFEAVFVIVFVVQTHKESAQTEFHTKLYGFPQIQNLLNISLPLCVCSLNSLVNLIIVFSF